MTRKKNEGFSPEDDIDDMDFDEDLPVIHSPYSAPNDGRPPFSSIRTSRRDSAPTLNPEQILDNYLREFDVITLPELASFDEIPEFDDLKKDTQLFLSYIRKALSVLALLNQNENKNPLLRQAHSLQEISRKLDYLVISPGVRDKYTALLQERNSQLQIYKAELDRIHEILKQSWLYEVLKSLESSPVEQTPLRTFFPENRQSPIKKNAEPVSNQVRDLADRVNRFPLVPPIPKELSEVTDVKTLVSLLQSVSEISTGHINHTEFSAILSSLLDEQELSQDEKVMFFIAVDQLFSRNKERERILITLKMIIESTWIATFVESVNRPNRPPATISTSGRKKDQIKRTLGSSLQQEVNISISSEDTREIYRTMAHSTLPEVLEKLWFPILPSVDIPDNIDQQIKSQNQDLSAQVRLLSQMDDIVYIWKNQGTKLETALRKTEKQLHEMETWYQAVELAGYLTSDETLTFRNLIYLKLSEVSKHLQRIGNNLRRIEESQVLAELEEFRQTPDSQIELMNFLFSRSSS